MKVWGLQQVPVVNKKFKPVCVITARDALLTLLDGAEHMAVLSLATKAKTGAPDDALIRALETWEDEGGRLKPEGTNKAPIVQSRVQARAMYKGTAT